MRDDNLSRRERQIMAVVYQRGQSSVADVLSALPDAPGYSAARALMRILEEKGELRHDRQGKKYVYRPTRPRHRAAKAALKRVVRTFFGNAADKAMMALLSSSETNLGPEEIDKITKLIERAEKSRTDAG